MTYSHLFLWREMHYTPGRRSAGGTALVAIWESKERHSLFALTLWDSLKITEFQKSRNGPNPLWFQSNQDSRASAEDLGFAQPTYHLGKDEAACSTKMELAMFRVNSRLFPWERNSRWVSRARQGFQLYTFAHLLKVVLKINIILSLEEDFAFVKM